MLCWTDNIFLGGEIYLIVYSTIFYFFFLHSLIIFVLLLCYLEKYNQFGVLKDYNLTEVRQINERLRIGFKKLKLVHWYYY